MVCDRGDDVVVFVGGGGVFGRGFGGGCVCGAGWVVGGWVYGLLRVVGVRVYHLAEPDPVAEVAGGG